MKVFVFQATLTKPPTDDDFEVEGLLGLPAAGGGGKKRGSADTTATGPATNLPFYVQVSHGKRILTGDQKSVTHLVFKGLLII